MNPQTKHVCVVGAGIVGLSTAWRLMQDGWQVSVIEESAAPGLVTSYANGAQLSYSYVAPLAEPSAIKSLPKWLLQKDGPLHIHPSLSPHFLRWTLSFALHCTSARAQQTTRDLLGLGYLSRRVLREWLADVPASWATAAGLDYRSNGKLVVFRNTTALASANAQVNYQRSLDVGCEQHLLSPSECVQTEPALAAMQSKLVGGIYTPSEDVVDSHGLCKYLERLIVSRGGKLHYDTRITGAVLEGSRCIALKLKSQSMPLQEAQAEQAADMTEFKADYFVVAAGLSSRELLQKFDTRAPLLGLKGFSITLDCEQGIAPSMSITDSHHKIVFAKLGHRLRAAGMVDLGRENREVDANRIAALIQQARDNFPDAGDYSKVQTWAGLRPATPSGRPIIDQTAFENVYANIGHGTLGLTLAAGSADMLADKVAGRTSSLPSAAFTFKAA
ncbi:MAG: D-amino acid dehydrogenase [Betaproteobacteria bacterium]